MYVVLIGREASELPNPVRECANMLRRKRNSLRRMGQMERMGVLRGKHNLRSRTALHRISRRVCSLLIPPEDMDYRWKVQFIRICMILGVTSTFYVNEIDRKTHG